MNHSTDFTTLSLVEVAAELDSIVRDTPAVFANLDERQLNWKPDASRWSVAQCLEHLVTANTLMMRAADEALTGVRAPTFWERLPVVPGVFGRLLVRSQAPSGSRKFVAPAKAQPGSSNIPAGIVERLVEQQRAAAARVRSLDERAAARAIMTSPFARIVTYSVLDGWRLIVAHDWRHIEQARRVTQLPDFPTSRS